MEVCFTSKGVKMGNNSNTPDWGNNGADWNQPQGNNADWNQPQGNNGADWNQPQGNWNNDVPDWNSNLNQNWNNPNQGNPAPNQNWGSNNAGWNNAPNQGNPNQNWNNNPNQNWGASQQAPQQPKKKKKHTVLYILLAVVVLFVIIGVANSGKTTHSSKTSSTNQSESSKSSSDKSDSSKKGNKKELAVGDSFEESNMKMTVDNIEFDWQVPSTDNEFTDAMYKPKDGFTYVKMDVTMENTGDSDKTASFTDFKLYADDNPYTERWGMAQFGVNPNGSEIAQLSAGRKMQFSLFWQVPVNATSVEVEYAPSFWSNEKILIKVK